MPPEEEVISERAWLTPSDIARQIARGIGTDDRLPDAMKTRIANNKAAFVEVVADAIKGSGLKQELTLLRLVEKIKDAIGNYAFGGLVIPGTVDTEGQTVKTPVGEIHSLLRDAYTMEFLDMFDEEGNPLPPEGS